MKKYELDKNDSIGIFDGIFHHRLDRVIYTDEFIEVYKEKYDVIISRIGGWIESEKNLSQDDYALILDEAKVMNNAVVTGHARVTGHAEVTDNGVVTDNAVVDGHSRVSGNGVVCNRARVSGYSWVRDNVRIDKDTMIVNVVIPEEVK